jgi:hypothetical protein
MAEAVQRYHNQREIVTMARFLVRKAVRQHWKEQGRRPYDYSQKELCEARAPSGILICAGRPCHVRSRKKLGMAPH